MRIQPQRDCAIALKNTLWTRPTEMSEPEATWILLAPRKLKGAPPIKSSIQSTRVSKGVQMF